MRFAATKLVEGDTGILEALDLSQNEQEMLDHIIYQMEEERGLDRAAAIAEMRFTFIQSLVEETVIKPKESKEREASRKIDQFLTGKYTAIPCFIGIMALVFVMTFSLLGAALSDLMGMGIDKVIALLDGVLAKAQVNPVVHSLVIDGVCSGVGSVLSLSRQGIFFFPLVIMLPHLFGLTGVIWVQPMADFLTTILTIIFAVKINRSLSMEIAKEGE